MGVGRREPTERGHRIDAQSRLQRATRVQRLRLLCLPQPAAERAEPLFVGVSALSERALYERHRAIPLLLMPTSQTFNSEVSRDADGLLAWPQATVTHLLIKHLSSSRAINVDSLSPLPPHTPRHLCQ
jgi:hypothetical protein